MVVNYSREMIESKFNSFLRDNCMQLPAEVIKTTDLTKYTALGIKFIFPHAPIRPVTLNNGMEMRAWYDLLSLDRSKTAKEDDILTSVGWINTMIDAEIASGTPSENIVLAGFSQGGVIALHTGLRYPKKLAGIIALSTYMPFKENVIAESSDTQKNTPIFSAHGTFDPVITITSWEEYTPYLKSQNYTIEAKSYPMEHSLCLEEINDISAWLQKTLI